ncbi:hypothetical protein D3C81_1753420 [compost metagenome]
MLCKTLCQQFATSDATNDQDPRCRHGNCLAQGWQRQQRFAVIATWGEAHRQARALQHGGGCLAHSEPALHGWLQAGIGQLLKQQPGCRLADHDDRPEALQAFQQQALLVIHSDGLDCQQRQAAAVYPRRCQALRQCRTVLGRPGQQQAPLAHGWPASP